MTHIVPANLVSTPVRPAVAVTPVNNVKFEITGTTVNFYETSEAFNNRDVFETFDLARAGAIQAFAQHKADILAAIEQTEKDLLATQAAKANLGNIDKVVPVVEQPLNPVVQANSPAVSVVPINP